MIYWLSRIGGIEWWNGILEWNTEINNLMPEVALSHYCMFLNTPCYVCTYAGNINMQATSLYTTPKSCFKFFNSLQQI